MRDDEQPVQVTLLRWPTDAATRTVLASAEQPRILILPANGTPPPALDDLEVCIWEPFEPVDVHRRAELLRRRVQRRHEQSVPYVDDGGLLRYGDRWEFIPDAQLPIVRLLIENLGSVVTYERLKHAYIEGGGTTNATSIRTALTRVRTRVKRIGLSVISMRKRGIMVELARDENR